ncbi:EutN/CcmL family microcompartment protein [bacterium]|nr:EutN/CcmL family microcompartment protein [candidate division CSSED10-310 bacterium]
MKPALVIGRVVASVKDPSLKGVKLLLLRCIRWSGETLNDYLIAADSVGAGAGEKVFYVEARDASIAVHTNPPIDAAIIGIIDGVDFEE